MSSSQCDLILIKGEDKTSSVVSWRYGHYNHKPVVFVTYGNGKRYTYSANDVKFLKDPENIPVMDKVVLYNGLQKYGAEMVQMFDFYCRIVYRTGYSEICIRHNVKIVDSALNDAKSKNCFAYLKSIAVAIGLSVDGHNILASRYDKIDFIREDSVLASFLNGKRGEEGENPKRTNVYPFGFNLSQRQAIDNALASDISIIEGPPGTGKTQTILNIIANAVMRGESVAVVSSNNSATANVLEKLNRYGAGFIAAPLGDSDNKNDFIQGQTACLPNMSAWKTSQHIGKLSKLLTELDGKLRLKNELSALMAEKEAVEKEKIYFEDYYKTLAIDPKMPPFPENIEAKKILMFATEYEYLLSSKTKIGLLKKLKLIFQYGWKIDFIKKPAEMVMAYCQSSYYERRLSEISKQCDSLSAELKAYDFDRSMQEYSDLSMKIFKSVLADKYREKSRKIYTLDDLWKNADAFILDYPVILSTAYSLRSSLSSRTCYDYVIVDEASQVDLVTGALALSCARKAVIVGDLKQLPNVVNEEQKKITNDIFNGFSLPEAYRYSDHSLLSSVVQLFPDAPHVLLKEHYRCHPEIIGFCNQRFYNNELIILTSVKTDRQPMMVYRTAAGNMARGHVNERQIEVIKNEVFPEQHLDANDGSVGIVTPYRDQANRLQQEFAGTSVKADTADKFQGQERSVMIFSTVDNEIGEFASDPNRLNVAVSRAVDQFIVVTDGNNNDKASPIHDLIGYIQYHNHEIVDSEIHSVFDYLYEANSEVRKEILRKYGRASEFDSENLMLLLIKNILAEDNFSKFGVVMHVPLRDLLCDLTKLDAEKLSFATNSLTHVDFLIFSRLTHQPILVIEVDGFAYHNNEKQKKRDAMKDSILKMYGIPILRLSTVGSGERERVIAALTSIEK